jgi:hypothetical protein
MTEAEWLNCDDPKAMIDALRFPYSTRKFRLFALACCARIDRLITDPRSRAALDFVARTDGGPGQPRERTKIRQAARAAWAEASGPASTARGAERAAHSVPACATGAVLAALETVPRMIAYNATESACAAVGWAAMAAAGRSLRGVGLPAEFTAPERAGQTAILRDIFGNPFRPVAFDPAWRGDTVVSLAKGMYDSRDFSAMPVLADALQDAGCDSNDILDHCRGQAPHVRGCWVVDLVLDKE